jgi:hypothetical protein
VGAPATRRAELKRQQAANRANPHAKLLCTLAKHVLATAYRSPNKSACGAMGTDRSRDKILAAHSTLLKCENLNAKIVLSNKAQDWRAVLALDQAMRLLRSFTFVCLISFF